MSLLFSRLTQDFVEFGTILQLTGSSNATEAAQARADLPVAAGNFKHSAALNASYLVYIGTYATSQLLFAVRLFLLRCRYRYVPVHVHVHGRLGLHRRSQREASP